MNKIPLFGTQSLNSITNLKNLIESIDYPVEILSIVINNENVNFFLDMLDYSKNKIDKELIEKVDISFHPTNLGCPGSWNYHFTSYPQCDYFVKSDDDVVFHPGGLEKMVKGLEECDIIFHDRSNTKYACFALNKKVLKEVGLFDTNHYPCNYEDDDYEKRLRGVNVGMFHDAITHHQPCGTSRNMSPEDHEKYLQKYIVTTEEYHKKKWNGEFGDPLEWSYNFDYRENKVLRFGDYK